MDRLSVISIAVFVACTGFGLAQAPAPRDTGKKETSAPVPINCTSLADGISTGDCGLCDPLHGPDGSYCRAPKCVWASAEYLLWWIKDTPLPPLVTSSPAGTVPTLGAPTTAILIGGGNVDNELRSGGRFRAGIWLDDCNPFGVEGSYFFLGQRTVNSAAGGSGAPGSAVVGRPFFNVVTGMQDVQLVASPNLLSGAAEVSLSSRLQGAEANGVCILCCSGCCDRGVRVDMLGGFRYLDLDEGLNVRENLTVFPQPPSFPGAQIALSDQFDTRNRFYGGQLGVRAEAYRGRFFANILTMVALGVMDETVDIHGATLVNQPGQASSLQDRGLLAQPTNSGRFNRDQFAVVPEVNVNVGYQVTDHFRVFTGYSFLYFSNVVRPGDQIDLGVNPRQLVPSGPTPAPLIGPARPAFAFRDTDFWAQGINFGLEFRY